MSDKKIIKSILRFDDKELVSYASDWDLYEGELSWDDLRIEDQDRIILALTSNDEEREPVDSMIMGLNAKKNPIDGLHILFIAISSILCELGLFESPSEWSDKQQKSVTAFLARTMLGARLEIIHSNKRVHSQNYNDSFIYEAELERLNAENFNSMLDLQHKELKSFAEYVLSRRPQSLEIKKIKNALLSSDAEDETRKIAAVLQYLSKRGCHPSENLGDYCINQSIYEINELLIKLKSLGILNYVSTENQEWFDPDRGHDDALDTTSCVVWLTESGKQLALSCEELADGYLSDVQKNKDARDKRKLAAISKAETQREKLIKKVEGTGGWVKDGLYHNLRRVRAKRKAGNWVLSDDEQDLIKAIGAKKFSTRTNRADLKKHGGLTIKSELAPVDIVIDEWGSLSIQRIDEWGQDAKPDNRPILKKLGIYDWKDLMVVILLFPWFIADFVGNRLSSKSNVAMCIIFIGLSTSVLAFTIGDNGVQSFIDLLYLILSMYLLLPLMGFWPKTRPFKGE